MSLLQRELTVEAKGAHRHPGNEIEKYPRPNGARGFDLSLSPCAPLGRGDGVVAFYQCEFFGEFTLRSHRCPRWGRIMINFALQPLLCAYARGTQGDLSC